MAEFWKLHCITYDNDVISKNLAVINMAEFSKTRQIMTVFNIASNCKVGYKELEQFPTFIPGHEFTNIFTMQSATDLRTCRLNA